MGDTERERERVCVCVCVNETCFRAARIVLNGCWRDEIVDSWKRPNRFR